MCLLWEITTLSKGGKGLYTHDQVVMGLHTKANLMGLPKAHLQQVIYNLSYELYLGVTDTLSTWKTYFQQSPPKGGHT